MASKVKRSFAQRAASLLIPLAGGVAGFACYNIYTGNEKFYRNILMPISFKRFPDPEQAHRMAILLFSRELPFLPACKYESDRLKTQVFGLDFANPLGMAAGFDKQGECVDGVFHVGFGFTEIGSVTPEPQAGNAQPRVFRLIDDAAVINRYGFNSDGFEKVFQRLLQLRKPQRTGPLGVNLGKNKTSEDPIEDYVSGVKKFGRIADYLVVNISSPNTPGLRDFQQRNALRILLPNVIKARDALIVPKRVPLLVKIAPDLTADERTDIAKVLLDLSSAIDGIIVGNTTVSRPANLHASKEVQNEAGGLSGRPLKQLALETLRDMYKLTKGRIPIIGCGGISDGHDAYERVRAGASLLQIYTAVVFQGPPVVRRILRELDELLKADGFSNVREAVGVDVDGAKRGASP